MSFKELPKDVDYSGNSFDFETPAGKNKIKFKLITGAEEKLIDKDLEQKKSMVTTLRYQQDFVILLLRLMEIVNKKQ